MKVLVAYASAHGSTRSIAENIGRFLAAWHQVTTLPMSETGRLDKFEALVLGSAIHDSCWLPGARRFLLDNTTAISVRRTWLFSVGAVDALPRPLRHTEVRNIARRLEDLVPASITVRGTRLFSGVLRQEDIPDWRGQVRHHLIGARGGDYRFWPEIRYWSDEIAVALEPAYPTT